MNFQVTAKTRLKTSNWNFDPAFLEAGETATIIGFYVAHPINPLYQVKRDRDGSIKAVYRDLLVECGALKPIDR